MAFKKSAVWVLLFALTLTLAACGGKNNEGQPAGNIETPKSDKKVELVWSGWSGEEAATKPVLQGMMDSWNQKNPNTQVKWVGWPWDKTLEQLIIRNQGSDSLDVAQLDMNWLKTLADMNVLVDLNTVFDPNWLKENIDEALLKAGQMNGKQLGIPWTAASIGMVYNPTLLQAAGVSEPPKTIAEFESVLQKLKESNKDVIPYAITTKDAGLASDFQAWLWTFGGSIYDQDGNVTINNDKGVQTATWLKSLKDKGYISMDISRFDARQIYAKNQVGFYDDAIMANGILKAAGVKQEDLDKSIKPLLRPVVNAGDAPKSIMWGHLLVMFNKSTAKEQAVEFMKHVISDQESVKYFESTGMLPVMKTAIANEKVQNNAWAKTWSEITKSGKSDEDASYAQKQELDSIIAEELQAILLGSKTPQKGLDDAASRLKTTLKK